MFITKEADKKKTRQENTNKHKDESKLKVQG